MSPKSQQQSLKSLTLDRLLTARSEHSLQKEDLGARLDISLLA